MVFTGKWVSPVAKAADIIAVVAVSLGVAGSLGLGLMQISSGIKIVGGITGDPLWLPVVILTCPGHRLHDFSLDRLLQGHPTLEQH